MAKLLALSYSPWSEKARWALDHHGIAYVEEAHVPMLGELKLRATAKKWRGRVTVPVFVNDAGDVFSDSFDIAKYAERAGSGAPLFPAKDEAAIAEWNETSERAMAGGRAAIVAGLAASPEAMRESLPGFARSLGPITTAMATMGVRFFRRKYGLEETAAGAATVRESLDALRLALGKRDTLLADFSYADVAMALLLQAVVPVEDRYIHLGPVTRERWTNRELAKEYADLVAWRDRLYAKHRKATQA